MTRATRQAVMDKIRELRKTLDRNPTVKELAVAYGSTVSYLYWLLPRMQNEGLIEIWPKTVSVKGV